MHAALLRRLGAEPLRGMVGPDYVTGAHLPSHSDAHISCLTGLKIQVLPDGGQKGRFSIVLSVSSFFEM